MTRHKALLIGGSSPAAAFFVNALKRDYDLEVFSTRKIHNIVCRSYDEADQIKNIKYNKLVIYSSGVPAICKSSAEYKKINNSIKRIINNVCLDNCDITFMSSYSVYNKFVEEIDKNTPYSPADFYGESKVMMEEFLNNKCESINNSLNILRLPVYLYRGVKNNFMGAALAKIRSGEPIQLSNPDSRFFSVIDDSTLFKLDSFLPKGKNIINCSSNGDISFNDLARLFKKYGAKSIQWVESGRPSVNIIHPEEFRNFLNNLSTSKIVTDWMSSENYK